ncbi:MAG TPA: murein L,D-transpeptidase catalytic domain family protein, partial [Cryomorphaceae bacterium]|nr:murein L,D-transpeptidase catalytic domain family protein [Cryomorphaceae bacterium]
MSTNFSYYHFPIFKINFILATFLLSSLPSFSQVSAEADSVELWSEREIHRSFGEAQETSISEVKSAVNRWSDYSTFVDSMALEIEIADIYHSLYPRADSIGLDYLPFKFAMIGYFRLRNDGMLENDGVLTIIDYTKPSAEERFYCIDLVNLKFLFHTYVSHGKNTGVDRALKFSNRPQSLQSSLGLYVTGETYVGSKGYSLRLDGVEKGINDN